MNIEEAKDRCKNLVEYGLCYSLENTDLIAIDIVLNELDNRIPKEYIEDKIEKVRCETTYSYNDWKYDKKVYRAEHNIINIIEKELLNKE